LVGVYRIIGTDRHGSRSQPKPEKTMEYTKGQAIKAIVRAGYAMEDIFLDEENEWSKRDHYLARPARKAHDELGYLYLYLGDMMEGDDDTQVELYMSAKIHKALKDAQDITDKFQN